MAAYAALVSLVNLLEQVLNHPHLSIFDKYQLESIGENLNFLLDFIESNNTSHGDSKGAKDLEIQITSAAHSAEDVIESHVVDRIRSLSSLDNGETSSNFFPDLQTIIEDIDSNKEKVMKFKKEREFEDMRLTDSIPAALSRPLTSGKNAMVGFDDELIELMDVLTRKQSSRQIVQIVGMGGIGKTTLAKSIYENLVIIQHFDIRAWANISQTYSVREILVELLDGLRKFAGEAVDELGEQLYKTLYGRRYLIVLDDVWSRDVWDKMGFFFPDNGNGSRIVMTTRISNMPFNCSSSSLAMNLLDEDKSWKLFCEKAFEEEACPPELVHIGKNIAVQCKGLPLSISVIGGLLRNSKKMEGYWEEVAGSVISILSSGEEDQCMNVLSLSYNYLPAHLKPCFLFMGVFREDQEINVHQLVKLWVAEGFLKPSKAQSLEEVAEGYLKDLIERNLVLIRQKGCNGKINTCGLHDLLRESCLSISKKENFFQAMAPFETPRRIVFHGKEYHNLADIACKSTSLARSLIGDVGQMPFVFTLLRILTEVHCDSLQNILQQVNLRYLEVSYKFNLFSNHGKLGPKIPSSISLLWYLQTLIIKGSSVFVAPPEIWSMQQLRHLDINKVYIPDPPQTVDNYILPNLQTLKEVVNFRLSEEVCKRIPSVKKLHILYDDFSCESLTEKYCLNNLGHLHELQSLNCSLHEEPERVDLLRNLAFMSSLRKLSLGNHCCLSWEDLTRMGFSLPHLEVLKLGDHSVVGTKWDPVEGAFPHLKFLKICCSDLVYWNADNSHFPILEGLVLCNLGNLYEIPLDMAEIPTLGCIRLEYCSVSADVSSIKILEEQLSLGNEDFQVRVCFWNDEDKGSFLEKVEIKNFTSKNFAYQSRVDQIVKLFNKDPNELPSVLRKQIHDWISHSPTELESFVSLRVGRRKAADFMP